MAAAGAALALAGAAAAADAVGPAGDPVPRPARCVPSAARQCTPVRLAGTGPSTALLGAIGRRGLGIARPAGILGARGAARLRARMLAGLTRSRPRVRAELGVRAQQAAPGGRIRDAVAARGSARRGRAGIAWSYEFDASIDRCPDPGPRTNSHGLAPVDADATYAIQTREVRRDGAIVETDVTLVLVLRDSAYSTRRAELDRIGPGRPLTGGGGGGGGGGAGGTPVPDVEVTRTARVIPRPGVERELGRQRARFDAGDIWPTAGLRAPDDFGDWIRRMQAQEDAEPGPDDDGPILGPAWRQLANAFLQQAAQRIARLGRAAERHWRTPGACVALDLDGPSAVLPGGKVEIRGLPRSTARPVSREDLLADLFGAGSYEAQVVRAGTLRNLIDRLPIPPDRNWLEYAAPAQPWTASDRPGAKVTFSSKAGIGEATRLFDPKVVRRITGTFGGTWTAPTQNGTGTISFDGTATFDRATSASGGADGVYELSGGGYTISFSGGDVSGGTGCRMSGAGSFTLRAGDASGSVTVTGTGPSLGAPWSYQFMLLPAVTDRVTVTRSACPSGGDGTTAQLNAFAPWQTTTAHRSADGITYADSEDQRIGGSGQVIGWSFQGAE